MLTIFFTKNFVKEAKKLPKNIQEKLAYLLGILEINPYDKRLSSKKLKPPLTGILSFRIGINYRALFIFESSEEIKLLSVRNRKDIYSKK